MDRETYILLILIAGIVLYYMGFYNHFPLMHSDSGTAIKSGFLNQAPPDRHILYSVYINVAVCGVFSFVAPRYQSRVVWLLILPVILAIFEFRKSVSTVK